MSIFKKIRYWIFPCTHEWVQGAEYWHNKTGENYDYLLPEPMKYHPGWQANCYICTKCGQTITTIEKIEKNEKVMDS